MSHKMSVSRDREPTFFSASVIDQTTGPGSLNEHEHETMKALGRWDKGFFGRALACACLAALAIHFCTVRPGDGLAVLSVAMVLLLDVA